MPARTILETLRLETLSRPVRADRAMKMSLAFVALAVALTVAQALTKPHLDALSEPARIATASTLKPVILAIDWQENAAVAPVALAYAR